MYKAINKDDIFNAADGNRNSPMMTGNGLSAPLVNTVTEPEKPMSQMSDAEAIRAMGDKLSKIWSD
jgi:hypothetical protein|tara:strand:- start:469 stop:666 length:198 start_codon:yes stop_codon:yes gene_type:complete